MPPLALPAHFGPAAKEGERAQRKQSRKRDHKVTERVHSCSRKRYEIHMEFARGEAFEGSPVAKIEEKKVNKNHRVWLAGQRAGAVT